MSNNGQRVLSPATLQGTFDAAAREALEKIVHPLAVTDEHGLARFAELAPGTYQIFTASRDSGWRYAQSEYQKASGENLPQTLELACAMERTTALLPRSMCNEIPPGSRSCSLMVDRRVGKRQFSNTFKVLPQWVAGAAAPGSTSRERPRSFSVNPAYGACTPNFEIRRLRKLCWMLPVTTPLASLPFRR